eukprot:c2499_g1_i1.p1 GENE.c2499_g1_i1~~c2499_g1_i1.p1  ORF type:complete len:337 (-),score=101.96 c2499_g1_i1:226-1236(-)
MGHAQTHKMAKSMGSYFCVAAFLFFTMEVSFFGAADAMSMGQTLQALPALQASSSLLNMDGFKLNLPTEAQDFLKSVQSKIEEDPSILKQPASWENILSFVELASGKAKATKLKASKKSDDAEYSKKTPVQKIVHHLFEEAGNDDDDDDSNDAKVNANLIQDTPLQDTTPVAKSNPFQMVIFFVICLVLVGGLRYLAMFLTSRNRDVDPLDYIIGTKFTMASLISGLVAGFAFSFLDSIVLFWSMIFLEGLLTKLPNSNEEASYAAYANIFSNLVSGALSTSLGAITLQSMGGAEGDSGPFWAQLLGALLGGVLGVLIAKIIPHKRRLRAEAEVDA